jgi:RNA-directed DNA polymerase
VTERLGLKLHSEKTGLAAWQGERCLLGLYAAQAAKWNPRGHFMQRWPSTRATKRLRERVQQLTCGRRSGAKEVKSIIADLNPVLREWGNYFRSGKR